MKTFIFATDFSENANHALSYAASFVQKLGGRLLLFHALDHANPYVEVPAYVLEKLDEEIKENARKKMEVSMAKVSEIAPTLPCEYRFKKGHFLTMLLNLIEEESANGVLMGTKGATGLKKVLMGSNTATVIAKTSCPVLAIPESSEFTNIDTIAYATDFKSDHGFILEQVKELSDTFDAKIEIIHVAAENQKVDLEIYDWYQEAVKMILSENQVSFKVLKESNVQVGISNYAKEEQPDLVIMSMNKKDWIDRLLKGSHTKQQVYHIKKPLLVFHVEMKEKVIV